MAAHSSSVEKRRGRNGAVEMHHRSISLHTVRLSKPLSFTRTEKRRTVSGIKSARHRETSEMLVSSEETIRYFETFGVRLSCLVYAKTVKGSSLVRWYLQ